MKAIKSFMAFAKGVETKDAPSFKRYIGIAPCMIKAINPTKSEMEKIFNTTLENEPSYVGSIEVDGEQIPNTRICFIVQPMVDFAIEPISISFFLRKQHRFNRDKTKIQVIDKYGRTAWVTKEQLSNHEIPMYSNGPASLDKDYRPLYIGEEELTKFLVEYLGIPLMQYYKDGQWHDNPNPAECECRFGDVEKMIKGDISEVKEYVSYQPENKVKILFGVRNTDDGKQYQSFYNNMFLRNNSRQSALARLEKDLKERKEAGAFSTTDFEVVPLKEYVVKPTVIAPSEAQLPFDNEVTKTPWD